MNLIIYRNGSNFTTVKIDKRTVYTGRGMAENKIVASFETSSKINFIIGDYIQHNGKIFKLNDVPAEEQKNSRHEFIYSLVFEGIEYDFDKIELFNQGRPDFPYTTDLAGFINLIVDTVNIDYPGFTIAEVDAGTEIKTLDFDSDTGRTALAKVCEAYSVEHIFNNTALTVKKSVGVVIPNLSLSYGQGNGLYSLSRRKADDSDVYTRVFGFGGSDNLPANYRNGSKRLSFDVGYVERNVNIYGVRKKSVVFSDIRPERTGTITAIPDFLTVIDSTLDFNLNDVIVDGQAKIVFTTGALAGNAFEIASYNNNTKSILFKPNTEESYSFPNDTVKAAIGDKYKLIGITMPQSYINDAELRVKNATIDYAEAHKSPSYSYVLFIDEKFIRQNNLIGAIGIFDRINVSDSDFNINQLFRVTELTYPLVNPSEITAVIGEKVSYTQSEKVLIQASTIKQQVVVSQKEIKKNEQAISIKMREFANSVFDPDGYFDPVNIKPQSVSTIHLSVATRSQDFSLTVLFKPNYNGDSSQFQSTAGILSHNSIEPNVRAWNIAANVTNGLVASSLYYIYAKCNINTTDGIIELRTDQFKVDHEPGYYYFLIGALSSSINGVRYPSLSYGGTEINGRFLTTGRVQSRDGSTYFDLDSNEIRGTISFLSGNSYIPVTAINENANTALTNATAAQSTANTANTAANLAISNAAAVQANLTSLQNGLGGLAYASAVEVAQLGTSIISGGYIKANLLDVNAIVVTGGLATQTYANNAANNALTNATALVNNLKIGGRNLLLKSNVRLQGNSYPFGIYGIVGGTTDGKEYTLVVKGYTAPGNDIGVYFNGYQYIGQIYSQDPNNVQVFHVTRNNSGVGTGVDFYHFPNASAGNSVIEWAVLYEGNVKPPLDWIPAPEDVDSAILLAQATAIASATTLANAAQTSAQNYATSQSAFDRELAKSYADGKVTAEEAARITQASANLAEAKADSQSKFLTAVTNANGYTDTKTVATIAAAQSYADSVSTTKANAAQLAAVSSSNSYAQSVANTAQSNAVTASQQLINSLAIGGVNILSNSKMDSFNGWSSNGGERTIVDDNGEIVTEIISNGYGNGQYTTINIKPNTDYTISFDIKAINYSQSDQLLINLSTIFTPVTPPVTTNRYSRFNYTVNSGSSSGVVAFIVYGFQGLQAFRIKNIKVEEGNKATSWSPSISDVDDSIALVKTTADNAVNAYSTLTSQLKVTAFQDIEQWAYNGSAIISGGYISANLLNVGYIQANVVTASYINALEIVSKSIRTANPGTKRVEITQESNSIRILSAANEVLIDLDDDAAFEGFKLVGGVSTRKYGPGIRVGSDEFNSSSMGRNGFVSTAGGVEQHFIGDTIVGGLVSLDVENGFFVKNIQNGIGTPGSFAIKKVISEDLYVDGNYKTFLTLVDF